MDVYIHIARLMVFMKNRKTMEPSQTAISKCLALDTCVSLTVCLPEDVRDGNCMFSGTGNMAIYLILYLL